MYKHTVSAYYRFCSMLDSGNEMRCLFGVRVGIFKMTIIVYTSGTESLNTGALDVKKRGRFQKDLR